MTEQTNFQAIVDNAYVLLHSMLLPAQVGLYMGFVVWVETGREIAAFQDWAGIAPENADTHRSPWIVLAKLSDVSYDMEPDEEFSPAVNRVLGCDFRGGYRRRIKPGVHYGTAGSAQAA